MSKKPVRVAVTGAAGQIGYALLFRIASGEMLGKDQPVILQLLEIPDEKAQKALKGVMMELDDCAFPLLAGMEAHADPMTAFKDTDYALLVGSRPRGPGMERAELLAINGAIFTAQGKALNAVASRNVKVLSMQAWLNASISKPSTTLYSPFTQVTGKPNMTSLGIPYQPCEGMPMVTQWPLVPKAQSRM